MIKFMRTHLWRGLKNLEDVGDAFCSDAGPEPERGRLSAEWERIFSICFEADSKKHENNRSALEGDGCCCCLLVGLWAACGVPKERRIPSYQNSAG